MLNNKNLTHHRRHRLLRQRSSRTFSSNWHPGDPHLQRDEGCGTRDEDCYYTSPHRFYHFTTLPLYRFTCPVDPQDESWGWQSPVTEPLDNRGLKSLVCAKSPIGDFSPRIYQIMCMMAQPQVLTWGSPEVTWGHSEGSSDLSTSTEYNSARSRWDQAVVAETGGDPEGLRNVGQGTRNEGRGQSPLVLLLFSCLPYIDFTPFYRFTILVIFAVKNDGVWTDLITCHF